MEADADLAADELPDHTELDETTPTSDRLARAKPTPTPSQKPVTKKRRSEELHGNDVQALTSAATKVLTQIATQRQSRPTENTPTDKDWDFCRYLYCKLKAIPECDEKEDMLLEIQTMINRTRRQCLNRTAAPLTSAPADAPSPGNPANVRINLILPLTR